MPHAFSRRLAPGPLLCDGAMGTLLYARGVALRRLVAEVLDALR
jgi:hypothetical protein